MSYFIGLLEATAGRTLVISCERWYSNYSASKTKQEIQDQLYRIQKKLLLQLLASAVGIYLEIWPRPSQINAAHKMSVQVQ